MASSPAPAATPRAAATPPASPKSQEATTPKFEPANQNKPTDAGTTPPATTPAAPPQTPPADQKSAAPEQRQQQIKDWAETKSDHSGGFLGIGGTDSSEKVRDALAGKSELGPMSQDEQRVLADRMIDRWDAGRGDGPSGPTQLIDALKDAPDSRAIVGQELAARSASITKATPLDPNKPDANWEQRARATNYARNAVDAAGSADDPAAAGRLRETVERLGPEGTGNFAQGLIGASPYGGPSFNQDQLSQTLNALNGGQPSEARSAFVQNAFAKTQADDYAYSPDLQRSMAQSLAREWHPDDPAAAKQDEDRLAGILDTDQGRRLLGDTGKDGPSLETRVNALATVRADGSITGETLKTTDDPWTNPVIISPSAQASARQFLDNRGDAPVALSGTDLDNTVGTAMSMPPVIPQGTDPAKAEADAARGQFNYFGTGDNAEAVKKVADQIRGIAGDKPANVAVVPVTYSDGKTGPVQLPLFRVTDPSGAERYVDNTGRKYDDFESWRTENELPPGTQVYPENGHLTAGTDGKVALGQGNTPKTVDTFGEHLTSVLDTAALVGGVVAGGVLIVGSGGLATPAVLGVAGAVAAGAGAWGAYRSGSELVDRDQHGQSINPFTDGDARGLWLNLGASVASVGAFGSAARLAQLGKAGEAVAPLEASLHGYVQAGAFALDTAATANQGIETARNWDKMSAGDRAQSILQMGFWGVGAAVGMRASGTRNPGDMFNPVKVRDNILAANPPSVTADPSLQGNAVKIDYDPNSGVVKGIRHGPEATPEDIALHQRTAQNIQRSLTLEGQVERYFVGKDEPPPGTVGWAARQDIAKVQERLTTRAAELDKPGLTAERRSEIEAENAVDQQHLDELSDEVSSFVRDPNSATIDARNSKRSRNTRAERQNLPVGETSRTYGKNEATWVVNSKHETIESRFVIREIPESKERPKSETDLTSAVGREGGIKTRKYPERDDGGHMAGYQFLHEQGLINLYPQNSEFNQRVYTQFEGEMRNWVEAGAEVRARVRVGQKGADGEVTWGGDRPERVVIDYEVINPKTGKTVYTNGARFKNEGGQTFDGFAQKVGLEPSTGSSVPELQDAMRKYLAGN